MKPSATLQKRHKPSSKVGNIPTLEALAALVERDISTVSRWTKRPDWTFPRKAPWSPVMVPQILRWVADVLLPPTIEHGKPSDGGGAGDEMKELRKKKLREETRKLHAQADQAETQLARERGKLLDADSVEQEWASIGSVVRNDFQNLSSQIVPLALNHGMPNESAATFGQEVEAAVGGILKRLSGKGDTDVAV
jgi:hypothetical protein